MVDLPLKQKLANKRVEMMEEKQLIADNMKKMEILQNGFVKQPSFPYPLMCFNEDGLDIEGNCEKDWSKLAKFILG
jgi:hypothetical protein